MIYKYISHLTYVTLRQHETKFTILAVYFTLLSPNEVTLLKDSIKIIKAAHDAGLYRLYTRHFPLLVDAGY
jgi:hypothetical protein